LFKNRETNKSRSQLLIFVTPHIYYGADANVDPVKVLNDLDK
jgi:type II secretory pathway component GspD/PulD (secretin)